MRQPTTVQGGIKDERFKKRRHWLICANFTAGNWVAYTGNKDAEA